MSPVDRPLAIFNLLLLLTLGACTAVSSQSPEGVQYSGDFPTKEELVEGIWRLNERVILETTLWFEEPSENLPSLQDFSAAVEFFEEATGIHSHTGTYFGRLPNPGTHVTLAKWNAWFEENKDTLMLTPSSCLTKAPKNTDTEDVLEKGKQ